MPQHNPTGPRAPISRRFSFYFFGLAIGLVLFGFFQMMRSQAARHQQAQQAQPAQQIPSGAATPANTPPTDPAP
jgi:hypothetical protein